MKGAHLLSDNWICFGLSYSLLVTPFPSVIQGLQLEGRVPSAALSPGAHEDI